MSPRMPTGVPSNTGASPADRTFCFFNGCAATQALASISDKVVGKRSISGACCLPLAAAPYASAAAWSIHPPFRCGSRIDRFGPPRDPKAQQKKGMHAQRPRRAASLLSSEDGSNKKSRRVATGIWKAAHALAVSQNSARFLRSSSRSPLPCRPRAEGFFSRLRIKTFSGSLVLGVPSNASPIPRVDADPL